jgi:hypothetical protein
MRVRMAMTLTISRCTEYSHRFVEDEERCKAKEYRATVCPVSIRLGFPERQTNPTTMFLFSSTLIIR